MVRDTELFVSMERTERPTGLPRLYVYGDEPEVIDHIDRNRSNNAIENLRAVTFSQNSANRAAKSKNKSGFTGVYWNELGKKWQASIVANGRTHYVGLFATAQEAAKAED